MSQINYAANLSGSEFPFLAVNKTRTVVVPQVDQQYVSAVASASDKQAFIPDLYYCENVMPTSQGYQSIGFRQVAAVLFIPHTPGEIIIDVQEIYFNGGIESYPVLMAITTVGNLFVAKETVPDAFGYLQYAWTWIQTVPAFAEPAGAVNADYLSAALINGVQYIYVRYTACYKVDPGPVFTPVILTALATGDIRGISSAYGYMIAYGNKPGVATVANLAWSSTIDPTDFTPSLITGSGGGTLQEAIGGIIFCPQINGGFIVYCGQNAVAATWSGNARYPFTFKELTGCGGIQVRVQVATGDSGENHYLYGTKGLQETTINACANVYPSAEDFLGKKSYEQFDTDHLIFTEAQIIGQFDKALTLIASRYLIISYGPTANPTRYRPRLYTYALIYDIALQRWGKIKLEHSWTFSFVPNQFNVPNVDAGKNSFAFIDYTNLKIYVLDFDQNETPDAQGIAVFGKYQYVRTNLLQLELIELENIEPSSQPQVYDMYTLDGKDYISPPLIPVPELSEGYLRTYNAHIVGVNHSILIIGIFDLNYLGLSYFPHGRR